MHSVLDKDQDGKVTLEEYQLTATHGNRLASQYRHNYVIVDPAQVVPCFFVRFKYDQQEEIAHECESCNSSPAVVFCQADGAYLCADCDEEVHSVNKLVSRHVRTPIEELRWSNVSSKFFKLNHICISVSNIFNIYLLNKIIVF